MPSERTVRRGPRLIKPRPRVTKPGRIVLMPDLLGAVIRRARILVDVTQVQLAERLQMPQAAISKLERGQMTMSVYHLDLIADILTEYAEDQDLDPDDYFWEGWHLHAIASRIADRLESRGHVLLWEPASSIEDPRLYTRGKRLYEKVVRAWPHRLPE